MKRKFAGADSLDSRAVIDALVSIAVGGGTNVPREKLIFLAKRTQVDRGEHLIATCSLVTALGSEKPPDRDTLAPNGLSRYAFSDLGFRGPGYCSDGFAQSGSIQLGQVGSRSIWLSSALHIAEKKL